MAQAHDPVSEKALLNLTARSIGLAADRLGPADLLDDLEVSTDDLLALVALLEDQCDVVLPDCELARCETLGDLLGRLRARAVLAAVLSLDGRSGQMADAGRHDHGRRAPGRRSTSFCPSHAEQRQAS
jgi:acyl carrier protein